MKTLTNINVLFFLVYICIIAHKTHSYTLADRDSDGVIATESHMADELESTENQFPPQIHSLLGKRRLDSAEKYFDWAGKTNRPMEYLRGKRFWLFTKKDEHGLNHETMPSTHGMRNSVNKGIWRSGILGRRRR